MAAPWCPHPLLMVWRIVGALFLITLSIVQFKPKNFAFFTHWGIYICMVSSVLLALHELRRVIHKDRYTQQDWESDKSHFCLWKWSIFFLEAAFIFQNLIVLFFWFALYPGIDTTNFT